jgi:hypothetical protein
MKSASFVLITSFLVLVAGCEPTLPENIATAQDPGPTLRLNAEEVAMLAFLNDRTLTDTETLDVDCELRSDTAQEIMDHRDGADGEAGTADDNAIDTFEELDGIFGVGRLTLDRIANCATSFGYLPTPPELDMLQLLNDQTYADLELLDIDCGLHADAARNLIAHRDGPDGETGTADDNLFHSLAEVDDVPQMGIWNVNKLMSCPTRLF